MADTNPAAPSEQSIRERAYEIYLSREGDGDELSDWLRAERELMGSNGQEREAPVEIRQISDAPQGKAKKVVGEQIPRRKGTATGRA